MFLVDGFKFSLINDDQVSIKGYCNKLASIYLPNTILYNGKKYKVTRIDSFAFAYLQNINIIYIAKNIKTIEHHSFCKSSIKDLFF